ncbi:MAG: oligosaccharide flippase family protein, partial [Bacilli bacterium]|nr:oligosaccharide flippase family protein [Bacilli bacterium]
VIIFLGKFSTQFLSFFLLPLYTSYLNKADYGTVDLILTYITLLVPVVTLQLENGTFRYLIDARGNDKKIANVLKNSSNLLFVFSLIFSVLYACVTLFFKFEYYYIVVFSILLTMWANYFLQVTRGLGKNSIYSIASFVTGIVNFASNIIFIIVLKKGAQSILYSSIIANLVCSIFLIFDLKIWKLFKSGSKDKSLKRELIKYSWPLVPNSICWWLINASDRTIVSVVMGVGMNGIYAISTKFSTIISSMLTIFGLSWTESASIHINDEDRDVFFTDINTTIMRLFSSLCIGLIAFMPFIFSIFINRQYQDAYLYVPINILATFFNCLISVYSAIYIAKKMTKKVALTSAGAAFINIVVDFSLIKYIGLFAASISTVVAYMIMAIYRSFDLKKYVKIK